MKHFFTIGGDLNRTETILSSLAGLFLFFGLWQLCLSLEWVESRLLPSPIAVATAFPDLVTQGLVKELSYSIKLNLFGYLVALGFALPLGFLIGLNKYIRGLLLPIMRGFPYLPLSAATMLFIMWFGIYDTMKVSFLAFAIFVYLLPVTAQAVMKTADVYLHTAQTLGATKWQMVTKVYIPDTLARVWDDIVVLVAISWTYIIIAELINKTGGIGAMIYMTQRISRMDMTIALLFTLMLVGFCQDRAFRLLGNILFPHKKAR